jgi:hypothetical protein
MACFHPVQALRPRTGSESTKLIFNPNPRSEGDLIQVRCCQCVGCRTDHAREWAVRCVHEASCHEANSYLTLTYAPEKVPEGYTLVLEHFQDFMKRFRQRLVDDLWRKKISEHSGEVTKDIKRFLRKLAQKEAPKIKFFHAGEYGEEYGRPHYHALIFGYDFPDKKFYKVYKGNRLYQSEFLSSLWTLGYATIGALTFESAAYVARYCMKKITGVQADAHYTVVDEETGEIFKRKPEYTTMSRNKGIGKEWYDKYKHTDLYNSDNVVLPGRSPLKIPKYYDNNYKMEHPLEFEDLQFKRAERAQSRAHENTPERLAVRKQCFVANMNRYKREIE